MWSNSSNIPQCNKILSMDQTYNQVQWGVNKVRVVIVLVTQYKLPRHDDELYNNWNFY